MAPKKTTDYYPKSFPWPKTTAERSAPPRIVTTYLAGPFQKIDIGPRFLTSYYQLEQPFWEICINKTPQLVLQQSVVIVHGILPRTAISRQYVEESFCVPVQIDFSSLYMTDRNSPTRSRDIEGEEAEHSHHRQHSYPGHYSSHMATAYAYPPPPGHHHYPTYHNQQQHSYSGPRNESMMAGTPTHHHHHQLQHHEYHPSSHHRYPRHHQGGRGRRTAVTPEGHMMPPPPPYLHHHHHPYHHPSLSESSSAYGSPSSTSSTKRQALTPGSVTPSKRSRTSNTSGT